MSHPSCRGRPLEQLRGGQVGSFQRRQQGLSLLLCVGGLLCHLRLGGPVNVTAKRFCAMTLSRLSRRLRVPVVSLEAWRPLLLSVRSAFRRLQGGGALRPERILSRLTLCAPRPAGGPQRSVCAARAGLSLRRPPARGLARNWDFDLHVYQTQTAY